MLSIWLYNSLVGTRASVPSMRYLILLFASWLLYVVTEVIEC